MCQSAIDDVRVGTVEAVITVNSNRVNVMKDVTSILRKHNANVLSGYGCRLTRVAGGQFYIEAPRNQIAQINREIEDTFGPESKPIRRADEFRDVNRWVPTHGIVVFVKEDRTGVLADIFAAMASLEANVVTVAAGTHPNVEGGHSGHALIKAYVEDPEIFWDEFVAIARQKDWDRVEFTPVKSTDSGYVWHKDARCVM
jgi:predicted amino acid-binding ACT domain protein